MMHELGRLHRFSKGAQRIIPYAIPAGNPRSGPKSYHDFLQPSQRRPLQRRPEAYARYPAAGMGLERPDHERLVRQFTCLARS